jgi:hypothetical protein
MDKTHTFTKKLECPLCHKEIETDFEVTLPEELIIKGMGSSYRVKELPQEQKLKQNQLTEGIDQQSSDTEHKQEDIDQSLVRSGSIWKKGNRKIIR